jgi:hypothetical protein
MPGLNKKADLRIGRGEFFIKAVDETGTAGEGFIFAGQVTSAQYQGNEQRIEETDMTSGAGTLLANDVVSRKPTLKLTMKSFDARQFFLNFSGTLAKYTQAATPVVAESHANVKTGTYVSLNKMGPIASVVVKSEGGATTFDLDDDYTIDDAAGTMPMIYIVPGGAIEDGDTIEIDYTPTAYTAVDQIKGATKSDVTVAVRYRGAVDSKGPVYDFDVWKATVNPDGVTEFLQNANEYGSYDLTFTLLEDKTNHADCPVIDIRRVDNAD